jgi:hypothetical protein
MDVGDPGTEYKDVEVSLDRSVGAGARCTQTKIEVHGHSVASK